MKNKSKLYPGPQKNPVKLNTDGDGMVKAVKGEIKPNEADSLANIAGKMIASAKVQLDYYALTKTKPEIHFLGAEKDINTIEAKT